MKMNFEYSSKPDFAHVGGLRLGETTTAADETMSTAYKNKSEHGQSKSIHHQDEQQYKSTHGQSMKPTDVKNCDLVSLLLAATPPYLYNIPLVPQTFFFSEMLRSFVQAKTERQSIKTQQVQHRRTRKRSCRELSPPKIKHSNSDMLDKPLELTTTTRHSEEKHKQQQDKVEPVEKKTNTNFTAEKLANSSITTEQTTATTEIPPPPALWYPPMYPTPAPYGIDPLHFFIDLRVSAHIWDRKVAAEKETLPPIAPLNLTEKQMPVLEPSLNKNRHNSAFNVPLSRNEDADKIQGQKGTTNMHYILQNLKEIYNKNNDSNKDEHKGKEDDQEDEEEGGDEDDEERKKKKKCSKDLRALIGLELVVDYVKQESDVSDDEEGNNNSNAGEKHDEL